LHQFIKYFPSSRQMLFSSKDLNYIYSATKPELFIIKEKI